ncbi:NAD(P)H-hydrate epimerase, partial [Pseudomonas aeruginosa]
LPVLAVDIPSGLSADTGAVLGEAIRADLTVTFIGLKIGLFTGEAPARVGELVFDELGSDAVVLQALQPRARRLARNALPRLAARPRTAHKGLFGHLLVVGGDTGMGGAVLLAAESALRC